MAARIRGSAASRASTSLPQLPRSRGREEPSPSGADKLGKLEPFDLSLFRGGRDPFANFGWTDPLDGPDGFGGFGGFGSILKRFKKMSQNLGQDFADMGPGGRSGCGEYACQSFAVRSEMGPDGKVHTERFANSEVGNHAQGIREAQQAYSNSSTGIEKMGFERQLGDRGRKVVRERNRNSMERTTEMFRGMDESGREDFDRSFGAKAHYLPHHLRMSRQALTPGTPPSKSLPPIHRGQGHRGSEIVRRQ